MESRGVSERDVKGGPQFYDLFYSFFISFTGSCWSCGGGGVDRLSFHGDVKMLTPHPLSWT